MSILELNTNPVIKRIAVKAKCNLITPALIGSGADDNTDGDIIRDSYDNPYLPGSAIAGVLRTLLCPSHFCRRAIFGNEGDFSTNSPLWVYDSEFTNANIIEIDGVAIERDNKVAKNNMKYNFEAVDEGAEFTIRLLLAIRKNGIDKNFVLWLDKIIGIMKSDSLSFGAKTNRGFGRTTCSQVVIREFDLTNKCALLKWIEFDWNDKNEWEPASGESYSGEYSVLIAELKLKGSIMIRETRNIYENPEKGKDAPDYKHISSNKKPVIYGTSWAGSFRSGLYKLLKPKFPNIKKYFNDVFGKEKEVEKEKDEDLTVSKVVFGASYLEEQRKTVDGYRSITRVKIDRFTGGAANGALFTEMPWYGGKTKLEIRYPKDSMDIKELLLLGLDGINKGVIQIGGEASIGRGFFEVTDVTINGKEEFFDLPKKNLINAIESFEKKVNQDDN